jgi:hypothetical protein
LVAVFDCAGLKAEIGHCDSESIAYRARALNPASLAWGGFHWGTGPAQNRRFIGLRNNGFARSQVSAAVGSVCSYRALPSVRNVAMPAAVSSLTARDSVIAV